MKALKIFTSQPGLVIAVLVQDKGASKVVGRRSQLDFYAQML